MTDSEPTAARRPRRRWPALALIALAIGLVVYDGSQRTAPPPDWNPTLTPAGADATRPAGPTLRVATFNIHGLKGRDGRRDGARTAELLAGYDLVGLNEVRGRGVGPLQQPDDNQAAMLGERLAMAWLFAPTERRWWADHFGNGLLAGVQVEPLATMPLESTPGRGLRNLVLARAATQAGPITVLITHIDREDDRRSQLADVLALYRSLAGPKVLMGDLNSPPGDEQIARLLAETASIDVLAGTDAVAGKERIDWILVEGLDVVAAGAVDNDASDHPLVWAELALPAPPTEAPAQP